MKLVPQLERQKSIPASQVLPAQQQLPKDSPPLVALLDQV
jgi:hypothetical protein